MANRYAFSRLIRSALIGEYRIAHLPSSCPTQTTIELAGKIPGTRSS
jgi:hypothetical protein